MYDISRLLRDNPYPGRGIVLGRSGDDRCSVLAYFIMGRSANSRSRVFVRTDDGIRAQAFDPAQHARPGAIQAQAPGQHTLDCSMCLAPALPLPPASLAGAQPHPLAAALHPFAAAHIAALVGAPLPPRGPPAQA